MTDFSRFREPTPEVIQLLADSDPTVLNASNIGNPIAVVATPETADQASTGAGVRCVDVCGYVRS